MNDDIDSGLQMIAAAMRQKDKSILCQGTADFILRVRSLIRSLPQTVDGARVVPGMVLWELLGDYAYMIGPITGFTRNTLYFQGGFTAVHWDRIFSTKEAALASVEKKP